MPSSPSTARRRKATRTRSFASGRANMPCDRPSRPPLSSFPSFRTSERALVCTVYLRSCRVYAHALYDSRRDYAAGHATPARRVRAPRATTAIAHAAANRSRSHRSPNPFAARRDRPSQRCLARHCGCPASLLLTRPDLPRRLGGSSDYASLRCRAPRSALGSAEGYRSPKRRIETDVMKLCVKAGQSDRADHWPGS